MKILESQVCHNYRLKFSLLSLSRALNLYFAGFKLPSLILQAIKHSSSEPKILGLVWARWVTSGPGQVKFLPSCKERIDLQWPGGEAIRWFSGAEGGHWTSLGRQIRCIEFLLRYKYDKIRQVLASHCPLQLWPTLS